MVPSKFRVATVPSRQCPISVGSRDSWSRQDGPNVANDPSPAREYTRFGSECCRLLLLLSWPQPRRDHSPAQMDSQRALSQIRSDSTAEYSTSIKRPAAEAIQAPGHFTTWISDALGAFNRVYVIVDALDECQKQFWTPFLKQIEALATGPEFSKVRLLTSSREYAEIGQVMNPISVSMSLSTNQDLADDDLPLY